jgi:hypothetical protein
MESQKLTWLAVLATTLLLPTGVAAQVPADFPISDRLAIGGSIGVTGNIDERASRDSPDLSAHVDLPIVVGTRIRVEVGRARWFYDQSASATLREPVVVKRATVSVVRTFAKPVQSFRLGSYAGVGLGLYNFAGAVRPYGSPQRIEQHWTHTGFQALAGFEYVMPGERRSINVEAMLYGAGANSAASRVASGFPATVVAGSLSVGLSRRF